MSAGMDPPLRELGEGHVGEMLTRDAWIGLGSWWASLP
jgi:hypothetical protein